MFTNEAGLTIGNYPSVRRLLKGIFELKTPMPKYNIIWDVNIVLDYLKLLNPLSELPLSHLTYKLTMLLALASSQRVQTLQAIKIDNIQFFHNMVHIPIYSLLKTTTVKRRKFSVQLKAFEEDPNICVVLNLKEYIKRTKNLRGSECRLLISATKPYKPVTTSTISRWLKSVLEEAGIDTDYYKGHSTRAASCSKARMNEVSIEEIMKNAGWSNCETFHKFYNKPVLMDESDTLSLR